MRIRLVGDVAISGDDGREFRLQGVQPRLCLALLARERGRLVGRDELAEILWGAPLPRHWEGAVRGVVAKVRAFLVESGLGPDVLVGDRGRWRLVLPPTAAVDIEEAEAAGGRHAVALLDGEFVPGARGEWVDRQRVELDALLRRSLLEVAWEQGPDRLVAARRLVEVDPFDESARRLLMAIEAEQGDRRAALVTYDTLRHLLAEELGIRPEPETEALAARIRGGTIDVAPATGHPARPPMPSAVGRLVGRGGELGRLRAEWDEVVRTGTLRLVVVEGEAGAGKTRLALELAGATTGTTLWGRCGPYQGVAYEPILEALGRAVAAEPSTMARLGPLAADLAPVLPDLAGGASAPTGSFEDDAARSRLFGAITGAARAVMRGPSLWVVDDVHWAADDTLTMAYHLVATLAGDPLLLVVTTRRAPEPVAALLAHLTRLVPTTTLRVDGLDTDDVRTMLELVGVAGAAELAAVVRERTGGNPFLVQQLAALADAEGRLDPKAVPDALRGWIDRRVAALPRATARVLVLAAALGDDLGLPLLAACSSLPEDELLDACEDLVADRFLADAGHDRVEFAHSLVRDVVYEGTGSSRREWLHRRIASAVAKAAPAPNRTSSLALHLSLAGPDAAPAAYEAFLAAGREALGQAAWETAAASFSRALELPGARGPALVGLGRALRGAGRRADARAAFEEALELGRATGSARLVADAVLGLVGGGARGVAEDLPDADRAALLREAIGVLGPDDDDDLAVPLHGELAQALLLTDRVAEREALARTGLERARRGDDPALLAEALLWARIAHLGPEHAELRLAEMDELLALPASARRPEATMAAHLLRHEDLLLIGDRHGARGALADAAAVLDRYDHPYWRWAIATWEALGAVIDGRLEEAEAQVFAALSSQADHPEALACLGVTLVDIRLFQGRAGEVVDLLVDAADANPHIPCYRAVLALCLVEAGRLEEAAKEFETFATAQFRNIPDDTNRLLTLAVLADVAATLADREAGRLLLPLLRPHGHRQVILNCFGGGGAWWGAAADHIAKLEALEALDEAPTGGDRPR